MFSVNDPIIGPSRGSASVAKAYAQKSGAKRLDDVNVYIDTVYTLCQGNDMPDAALVVAQSQLETGGWTSDWWNNRLNPAGIGITGDPTQNNASAHFTAVSAARAHVAHLLLYATGSIARGGLTTSDDPRYGAYANAYGTTAKATTLNGLTNVWAKDAGYAEKIVSRANTVFPNTEPTQPAPPTTVTNMVAHQFVGLSKPVWLPTDILVEISIVPTSRTNVRSRQTATGQKYTTWHDTGNSGSTADSEESWLWYTMPTKDKAGYNFAADGVVRTVGGKVYRGKLVQLTPLNEVTWAAGTGEGNTFSYHIEQCFGGSNVWTNSLYVNAAAHAGLIAARGFSVDTSLKQHNVWYGKNCPGQIRARGMWNEVVNMTKTAVSRVAAAAGGDGTGGGVVPVPIPTYATTAPILVDGVPWTGDRDVVVNNVQFYEDPRVVVTHESSTVNIRKYASSQSEQTGEPIKPNMPIEVIGWVRGEMVGTEDRWWITKLHSRLWVGGTKEKPEDRPVEPTPDPTPEPVPDNDGTFKIVNGKAYYPANGENEEIVIEADEANLYESASLESYIVKTVPKGTVLKVAYWCIGDSVNDEVVWWVLEADEGHEPIENGLRVHSIESMERPN